MLNLKWKERWRDNNQSCNIGKYPYQRAGRGFQRRFQRSEKGKRIENHAKYEDVSKRTCLTIFPSAIE